MLGDVAALEVVIDVVVAQAEFVLVGLALVLVQQVGGGNLVPQSLRGAQLAEQGATLPLVQPRQRQHVRGAVAELREEPGDVLGGVVGADHQ